MPKTKPEEQADVYLSSQEVATRLGFKVRTINKMAAAGQLGRCRKRNPFAENSAYEIPESGVRAFEKAREEGATNVTDDE